MPSTTPRTNADSHENAADVLVAAHNRLLYQQRQTLLELNATLEQRVADRTAELEATVKHAQESSAAKGLFLAKMSHEIRTPMNGIIGMLEALRTTTLDATQSKFVSTAYSSAEILLALINDILDVTKIEAGKLEIDSTRFNLHELIHQVINLWKPQAEQRQLQLLHELLADVPRYVIGDPTRLRQILNNLLSNALKFTHEGGVNVAIDNMCSEENGPVLLRFAIQDTGIGMSRTTLDALFSQFTQADGATTTRIYGGSGLGLAICKQLVELMHGDVQADSTEGLGSCFTVILPFAQTEQDAIETDTKPAPAQIQKEQLHILVVDDNETNRIVCVTILERLGYRATVVVDGMEAVAAVRRDQFDMILMDCHMPILDGLDATQSIRAWERANNKTPLPIMAVSASAFADDRQRCAEAGMDDFLAKPITLNSLRAKLERWLAPKLNDLASPAEKLSMLPGSSMSVALPPALFSPAQFMETRLLAGANFDRILQRYIEDAQQQIDLMQQALTPLDAEVIRRCAHKLKGSSSSMGAEQLARLCGALESAARNGSLSHAASDVAAIDACYEQSAHALLFFITAD